MNTTCFTGGSKKLPALGRQKNSSATIKLGLPT